MWINLLGKSEIEAAGFQNDLIEMQDTGFLTPVVDSVKGNLIFMPGQIQCKITEQPDAESAVKIVFQHMMDHIKHGFCWGQDSILLVSDGLQKRLKCIGRKYSIHDLISRTILIQPNDPEMELQNISAVCPGKRILIRKMMVTDFIHRAKVITFQ